MKTSSSESPDDARLNLVNRPSRALVGAQSL